MNRIPKYWKLKKHAIRSHDHWTNAYLIQSIIFDAEGNFHSAVLVGPVVSQHIHKLMLRKVSAETVGDYEPVPEGLIPIRELL